MDGAREVDGVWVAGAGATLWRHSPAGHGPLRLASRIIAIPATTNAQLAEATGCRGALGLLAEVHPHPSTARIAGDNLAAIRYGAGTGRYRRLALQAQMEHGLQRLSAAGWTLRWQAVRRRLNRAADTLATLALAWASSLYALGHRSVQVFTIWHDQQLPPRPSSMPARVYSTLQALGQSG